MKRGILVVALAAGVMLTGCELDLEDDDIDASAIVPLSIEPATATISAATSSSILLELRGGLGDFIWSVTDTSLGTIDPDGRSATYTSNVATGQNFVIVTDALTNAVTAVITQQ